MSLKRSGVGGLFFLFGLLPSSYYTPIAVILAAFLIANRGGQLPTGISRPIIPLFLMGAGGAAYGLINQQTYDVVKDVWYLGKLIIVFVLGYLLGNRNNFETNWLRTTMAIAALATIPGLISLGLDRYASLSQLAVVTMGAIILVPFYWQRTALRSREPLLLRWLVVSPFLLVAALSLSRTTLLLFFVSFLGARGVFQSKGKMTSALVTLALLISIVLNMLPEYDINNITFWGKISNSLNELSFVRDDSQTEITANWRGFEAFRAFEQWRNGSLSQMVFGQGFGTSVDIGFYFPLLGDDVPPIRYLPILHNGYAMILVKYGVFGVLMFLVFCFIPLFSRYNQRDPVSVFAKRVASTASVSLILSMTVITGPFNLSQMDSVTLLMGWAMGLQARRLQQTLRAESVTPRPERVPLMAQSAGFDPTTMKG